MEMHVIEDVQNCLTKVLNVVLVQQKGGQHQPLLKLLKVGLQLPQMGSVAPMKSRM
jgi:hypothetical protein